MPRTLDFIEVLLGQPKAQGAGRSISIDLKDTIKTKNNNLQTIILNEPITATQVQPAIINPATKTVSLLPIENMEQASSTFLGGARVLFLVKSTQWL